MIPSIRRYTVTAALALLAPLGCGAPDSAQTDDGKVAVTESAQTTQNGLTFNGLTFNGLTFNGLTFNGLTWNGLTWNGLTWNGLTWNGITFNGLTWNGLTWNGLSSSEALGRWNALSPNGGLNDATTRAVAEYLIGCALPAGDSVTYADANGRFTFSGQIGLAPEWKSGTCDQDCQRWVSACMLARSDAAGTHVEISIRGPSRALRTVAHEERDYPIREATYYGNMFGESPMVFGCLPRGATSDVRVCGPSLDDCPMMVTGACEDVCQHHDAHGSFSDCGVGPRKESKRAGRTIEQAITVFLHK